MSVLRSRCSIRKTERDVDNKAYGFRVKYRGILHAYRLGNKSRVDGCVTRSFDGLRVVNVTPIRSYDFVFAITVAGDFWHLTRCLWCKRKNPKPLWLAFRQLWRVKTVCAFELKYFLARPLSLCEIVTASFSFDKNPYRNCVGLDVKRLWRVQQQKTEIFQY